MTGDPVAIEIVAEHSPVAADARHPLAAIGRVRSGRQRVANAIVQTRLRETRLSPKDVMCRLS